MKILSQFFIILFVAATLFIMKDDVKSVIDKVSTYLNKNINQSQIVKLTTQKQETPLPGKTQTPGALRVVDNLLSLNSNNTLSKNNVILLTNKNRKENGDLPALTESSKLDSSAEKKLQDMFTNQYFEHVSPTGVSIGDLGKQAGYEYILIGENLALGNFKDDAALVDAWMASVGHRANILNKHYTEIGVAVGKGKFEGRDTWMAVQHFGEPMSICPTVNQVLLGIITLNKDQINTMKDNLTLRLDSINKGTLYEGSTLNEQVSIYNNLVNLFNNLITITKQKIDNYNNQIRAFNLCISNNQ